MIDQLRVMNYINLNKIKDLELKLRMDAQPAETITNFRVNRMTLERQNNLLQKDKDDLIVGIQRNVEQVENEFFKIDAELKDGKNK